MQESSNKSERKERGHEGEENSQTMPNYRRGPTKAN